MASSCLRCYKPGRTRLLTSLHAPPDVSVCCLYLLWNIMRGSTHHLYTFPVRHATLCNPRGLHLKNQFAESIASSSLLPINRRSLSETVRRGFIHRTDQCFSPQRFFSSISKDYSLGLTDQSSPHTPLSSDSPLTRAPPAEDMLELRCVFLLLTHSLITSERLIHFIFIR